MRSYSDCVVALYSAMSAASKPTCGKKLMMRVIAEWIKWMLVNTAISRIISFFPHQGFDEADIAEYNGQTHWEYERIRDFLVLHYKATERSDSEFWNYCRTMPVPDTLQRKLDLFRSNGRIQRDGLELFAEPSWLQVMIGQRIIPQAYHPFADLRPEAEVESYVKHIEQVIAKCVRVMPTQADYIAKHCAAT